MASNLLIVESPAKAKTIEKILGSDFQVKSCYGHIRDLVKGDDAINIDNGFLPRYEISPDKKTVVSELKKLSKAADTVWLASDEDREGEAISWHLSEVLGLDEKKTKRIVFHEITKPAILKAIDSPRKIDKDLVDAQQARRVLDRLVGFELSPILWRKIKGKLSAGRVQSVAVRLIVEREREINNFHSTFEFRVVAVFDIKGKMMEAELERRFKTEEDARAFLEKCKGASFTISNLEVKPAEKSPAPPFTTSTLQQEASRKLGFGVTTTMSVAQKLYESGLITYMRTDSVNLSELAIGAAKKQITDSFGEKYSRPMRYTTKSSGAQEAHEAIRPTYFDNISIEGTSQEKRLYDLIYKRAIASQMSKAQIERTIATINISGVSERFFATGEVLKFDGFLRVYMESTDDDGDEEHSKMLPPVKVGEALSFVKMDATQKYARPSARYTEASLVKKLEELGIGRPSTFAPTISTIQKRGYVVKEDREGKERDFVVLNLQNNTVSRAVKKEKYGAEKAKLFPSDIGIVVTDFLSKHFEKIMDYGFTAAVEEEFDKIAAGKLEWNTMIGKFYHPFHEEVTKTTETAERQKGERMLGQDPVSHKNIYVKVGRYGAYAQIGESEDVPKPLFASLRKGQLLETITLEEALELFKLPRIVGQFEDKVIKANVGRFGPYIQHDKLFVSLPKDIDPYDVNEEQAIELIQNKRVSEANKSILHYPDQDIHVLNGRFGPYIKKGKDNFKIPKGTQPELLTEDDCLKIIASQDDKPKKTFPGKKRSG